MGQTKGRRMEDGEGLPRGSTGSKRIYFNSYFIRSFYFCWAILESLSRPLGIINIMSGAHWSEFSRWTTPLCIRPGQDELCLGAAAWTSCVRNKCFSFQMQLLLGYPRGLMFLILSTTSSSSSSSHNNNNSGNYSNNFTLRHIAAWRTTDVLSVSLSVE